MFAIVLARGALEIKGWGTHEFFFRLFGVGCARTLGKQLYIQFAQSSGYVENAFILRQRFAGLHHITPYKGLHHIFNHAKCKWGTVIVWSFSEASCLLFYFSLCCFGFCLVGVFLVFPLWFWCLTQRGFIRSVQFLFFITMPVTMSSPNASEGVCVLTGVVIYLTSFFTLLCQVLFGGYGVDFKRILE